MAAARCRSLDSTAPSNRIERGVVMYYIVAHTLQAAGSRRAEPGACRSLNRALLSVSGWEPLPSFHLCGAFPRNKLDGNSYV